MRKLLVIAALALTATSAQAREVHEFKFGGRVVRIEVPTNCGKPSCIHLSTKEKGSGRARHSSEPDTSDAPAAVTGTGATGVGATGAGAATSAATVPQEPARASSAPQQSSTSSPSNDQQAEPQPDGRRPVARLPLPERSTPADETRPTIAATANPAPADEPRAEPVRPAEPTPIGLWVTEKSEGRVRIEECGQALCGHTEGKPNEKILINMQSSGKNRWSGKIHDIRGGSTYASHMTLRGTNSLRVEGCAFGGLFCGGQTWTRAQ